MGQLKPWAAKQQKALENRIENIKHYTKQCKQILNPDEIRCSFKTKVKTG